VQTSSKFCKVSLEDETLIFCPKLDDRLGVYTILDLLPKLGVKMDILLTENEEIGQSTAADFLSDKQYNWMVEFDRCGTTTVSYDYDWDDFLRCCFDVAYGTFSDICYLEHLNCKGMNVGVGYHDEHSTRAYCVLEQYWFQIARFLLFYEQYAAISFPHTPSVVKRYESCGYTWGDDSDNDEDNGPTVAWCQNCQMEKRECDLEKFGTNRVCKDCGEDVYDWLDSLRNVDD
jgi:hypothetical protein